MFSLCINHAVPRFSEFSFQVPVDWKISEGEHWVVIGPNGAGKTVLIDMLQRKIALKSGNVELETDQEITIYQAVKSMAFRDIYSLMDCKNMYYQQRWNATDVEEAPVVASLLNEFPEEQVVRYTSLFEIEHLLQKRILSLSSGELRKFLITRILMTEPHILILDNPFIGLDVASREALDHMLVKMGEIAGLQTVLVLSNPDDIPEWIDWVLPVCQRTCLPAMKRQLFLEDRILLHKLFPGLGVDQLNLPEEEKKESDYEVAVHMENIEVKYGKQIILQHIDWEVKKGEKWALLGKNGSGKSTLLSLICGDNPQAYANRLILFGRRRGTGESIWDIKKRIGYLSPDMHTFYLQDVPCEDVVASGFLDSVGLYRKCNEEQKAKARAWLEIFGIAHLSYRSFVKISYGEQRLVLLGRAFVKDPELLILDEPLHGLDVGKKHLVREVIEKFCVRKDKTMIYVTHYPHEIPSCVTLYKMLG